MFFNFFKTKLPEILEAPESSSEEESILASVTYLIKKNSDSVIIDIEMNDYDDESTSAICNIIDVLSEDFTYAETINMIQNALINDKQDNVLLKIFTHISQNSRDKILKIKQESKKDEPCIKPSDML